MSRTLVLPIIALLTLASCDSEAKLEPYRCLEHLTLQQLVDAEGPPYPRLGWSSSGHEEAMPPQRIFDLEYATSSFPDLPEGYVGRLCQRLETELTQRCEVQDFWKGTESCAAVVSSPSDKLTGSGSPKVRLNGRVNLFAADSPGGGKTLVLTGTEWPG